MYQDLSIRSENVQRVYDFYINKRLLVNRRYQRKLVWAIEEKQAFIDSIIKGYPVPLILLAEANKDSSSIFEIIDGMQRLNAICSFIEGEFDINGEFFDLESLVETKMLVDTNVIKQKEPKMDRQVCTSIGSYVIPLSIYKLEENEKIDEVFRRINSNGRHLSRQEIRQAGSTGNFADLVRHISSQIRGDSSLRDKLLLNDMKRISITSRDLSYGINVDTIFWVDNSILRRENVRESKDEEIIADILAYILLKDKPGSSSSILDEYYGIKGSDNKRYKDVELSLQMVSPDKISENFFKVFDGIKNILFLSGKKFNQLIFKDSTLDKIPRYFQIVFLAFYELLITQNMKISNSKKLISLLVGVAEKHIKLGQGGGNWSAIERENNINGLVGVIKSAFSKDVQDPAINSWTTEFETILMQSHTEQNCFDFKLGFHKLDTGEFIDKTFNKVIKTLTAMANGGPDNIGYVIVGVADKKEDAAAIKNKTGVTAIKYNSFYVTGVNYESVEYHKDLDRYFQYIVQKLQNEPIEDNYKSYISRNLRLINYLNKDILIFKIKALDHPALYDNKYFDRNGANLYEIKAVEMKELFSRFK